MTKLVLVRHGLSEYNQKGLWAGWDNPPLTPEGHEQAQKTGSELKDIHFDYSYTSLLKRAQDTLTDIIEVIEQNELPIQKDIALNERNYGDFTAKNKWEVKEKLGDEEFQKLRRSWDYPIPNGESLKQVFARIIPYYTSEIEPKLKEGKNILVSASGNSLRALVKHLENIPDEDISSLEIGTGEAYVYEIDQNGNVLNKEIRGKNPLAGKI